MDDLKFYRRSEKRCDSLVQPVRAFYEFGIEKFAGGLLMKKGNLVKTSDIFYLIFGCPTANFGSLPREQPHSPDVNHCVFTYSTRNSPGAS